MAGEFTPPTLESQYRYIHPSNIGADRVAEMQRAIANEGVYEGEVTQFSGLTGAVEVDEMPNGFIRVMPDAILLPHDHPVRQAANRCPHTIQTSVTPRDLIRAITAGLEPTSAPASQVALSVEAHRDTTREANEEAARVVAETGTSHEALADFLTAFTTAADESNIGYGFSDDCTYTQYCGIELMHLKMVESVAPSGADYALMRCDFQSRRRPAVPDEIYTVVNMQTGDEFRFAHSDVEHIRRGEYVRTDGRGGVRTVDPREIAEFAGIVEKYGDDDPIIPLTRGSGVLTATLSTDEQIQRYERLYSLNETLREHARITFAPDSAEGLITYLGRSGSSYIAPGIHRVVAPEDTTVVIIDDEQNRYVLKNILETSAKWDDRTRRDIFGCIRSIDLTQPRDAWTRMNNVETLLWDAIRIDEGGETSTTPSIELLRHLKCDRYDFMDAVYKAAGGLYVESWTQKWGEERATRNTPRESLDEQRARAYAEQLQWPLMGVVGAAREAMHIPDDISPAEQIVMLMKQQGHIEKGMRLTRHDTVMAHRPDISVAQWAEICIIIDRCRDAAISGSDRATIEGYRLNPDAIGRQLERGPGQTSEQVAEYLIRPAALGY